VSGRREPGSLGRTEGLERLDEERASSMGAEGGRSGQAVDSDASLAEPSLLPRPRRGRLWFGLGLGLLAAVLFYRLSRTARTADLTL